MCRILLLLLPLFCLISSSSSSSSSASKTIDSQSSSSSPRGESAFHAGEVRQNTNPRHERYSHVRRTWLAARERTLRGRRLERLQADGAAAASSSSSSPPHMFMVEAKPIKKSIDELQAVVLRQSSQGYKDMLRALMVMYRQMSKWHQNVTEELHKIVQTSEHTENGLTGVNSDIKSIMQQLQHMEDTAAAAAAAAAVSSSSGKTPPSVDDVLDPVWDDYDPKNYQDYEVDGDVDSIFEKFVDKESQVPTVVNVGDFIERPVTEAKSKSFVRAYEWMPDKDQAELHKEDKKTAKVKVLATTHREHIDDDDEDDDEHRLRNHRGNGKRNYVYTKLNKRTKKPSASSAKRKPHQQQHNRKMQKEKKPVEMESRENEVFIDEEDMMEIKKKMKAKAEAKEFGRKKELRKKDSMMTSAIDVGDQVQGDVLTVEHLETRLAKGDISKLTEIQKKKLMKPYGDCSELLWRWKQEDVLPRDGIYAIRPRGCATFLVYCEFEADAQFGWTVIQRREDGSVNFDRDWLDYKKGFGQLDGEMWLGNYGIDCVTNQGGAYTLHVDVEKWDDTHYWAEYNDFRIEDEAWNYILRVQNYNSSSTAGDSLMHQGDHFGSQRYYHNQIAFSTKDKDHDRFDQGNCAAVATGGWWFNACHYSNLNGKYYQFKGEDSMERADGLTWLSLTNNWYSLKASTMKIKANYLSGL